MTVDVTKSVTSYDGKPMTDKDDQTEMTWRNVIFLALNNFSQDERPTSDDKMKCFTLSMKIMNEDTPDLSVEDRAYITNRIDKIVQSPIVYGRVKELFEEAKKE